MKRSISLLALAGLLAAGAAFAADYPTRPIRLVVPYPPGGGTDTVARPLGQKITESIGQPIVVDNRGGASEIIGTEAVARAAPDGYTLLMTTNAFAINVALQRKLPYDPARDFAPVGISQGASIAIAHAARHPDRVSKLVLNGGYALGRNKRGSDRDQETGQAYLTLMRHGWGDEHSAFLRTFSTLYFPGAPAEELKALAELQRMTMSAETAVKLRLTYDDIDVADLLPKVTAPTLVLHSRHDNAVPFEEGRRLASAIPNARFVALESENHVPLPEEPAWPRFLAEIDAFLRE